MIDSDTAINSKYTLKELEDEKTTTNTDFGEIIKKYVKKSHLY